MSERFSGVNVDQVAEAHADLVSHLMGELEDASKDDDGSRVIQMALLLGALGVLAAAARL